MSLSSLYLSLVLCMTWQVAWHQKSTWYVSIERMKEWINTFVYLTHKTLTWPILFSLSTYCVSTNDSKSEKFQKSSVLDPDLQILIVQVGGIKTDKCDNTWTSSQKMQYLSWTEIPELWFVYVEERKTVSLGKEMVRKVCVKKVRNWGLLVPSLHGK